MMSDNTLISSWTRHDHLRTGAHNTYKSQKLKVVDTEDYLYVDRSIYKSEF